jgi:hypothetical protein
MMIGFSPTALVVKGMVNAKIVCDQAWMASPMSRERSRPTKANKGKQGDLLWAFRCKLIAFQLLIAF